MRIPNVQRVQKVGNSLAVVIPAKVARALAIQRDDMVLVEVYGENSVVVRRLTAEQIILLQPVKLNF